MKRKYKVWRKYSGKSITITSTKGHHDALKDFLNESIQFCHADNSVYNYITEKENEEWCIFEVID
jgi:hypothetical protein